MLALVIFFENRRTDGNVARLDWAHPPAAVVGTCSADTMRVSVGDFRPASLLGSGAPRWVYASYGRPEVAQLWWVGQRISHDAVRIPRFLFNSLATQPPRMYSLTKHGC